MKKSTILSRVPGKKYAAVTAAVLGVSLLSAGGYAVNQSGLLTSGQFRADPLDVIGIKEKGVEGPYDQQLTLNSLRIDDLRVTQTIQRNINLANVLQDYSGPAARDITNYEVHLNGPNNIANNALGEILSVTIKKGDEIVVQKTPLKTLKTDPAEVTDAKYKIPGNASGVDFTVIVEGDKASIDNTATALSLDNFTLAFSPTNPTPPTP